MPNKYYLNSSRSVFILPSWSWQPSLFSHWAWWLCPSRKLSGTPWMISSSKSWNFWRRWCLTEFLSLEFHLWILSQCHTSTSPTFSTVLFLILRFIPIHWREDIITADVSIENLVIRNLSTFETRLAHLDLESLSLSLELGISDLRVTFNILSKLSILLKYTYSQLISLNLGWCHLQFDWKYSWINSSLR